MKTTKLISLVTFLLVVLSYIGINKAYYNPEPFKGLNETEIEIYSKLSEEDKITIIGVPHDSIKTVTDISDSTAISLAQIPTSSYQIFQEAITTNLTLAKYLFYVIRLLLIFYIFIYCYHLFTNKFKYSISFQSALYAGCKLTIGFCIFVISATMINQLIFNTEINLNILVQSLFVQFLNTLKIGVMYAVFTAIFLYFHPQNQLRLEQKRKKQEKK